MPERKREDLTIKFDPDLRDRLEMLKKRDERSLGWLIERCVEAHLPFLENPHVLNEPPPKRHAIRYTVRKDSKV